MRISKNTVLISDNTMLLYSVVDKCFFEAFIKYAVTK